MAIAVNPVNTGQPNRQFLPMVSPTLKKTIGVATAVLSGIASANSIVSKANNFYNGTKRIYLGIVTVGASIAQKQASLETIQNNILDLGDPVCRSIVQLGLEKACAQEGSICQNLETVRTCFEEFSRLNLTEAYCNLQDCTVGTLNCRTLEDISKPCSEHGSYNMNFYILIIGAIAFTLFAAYHVIQSFKQTADIRQESSPVKEIANNIGKLSGDELDLLIAQLAELRISSKTISDKVEIEPSLELVENQQVVNSEIAKKLMSLEIGSTLNGRTVARKSQMQLKTNHPNSYKLTQIRLEVKYDNVKYIFEFNR